jgi:hypothetical protein
VGLVLTRGRYFTLSAVGRIRAETRSSYNCLREWLDHHKSQIPGGKIIAQTCTSWTLGITLSRADQKILKLLGVKLGVEKVNALAGLLVGGKTPDIVSGKIFQEISIYVLFLCDYCPRP